MKTLRAFLGENDRLAYLTVWGRASDSVQISGRTKRPSYVRVCDLLPLA